MRLATSGSLTRPPVFVRAMLHLATVMLCGTLFTSPQVHAQQGNILAIGDSITRGIEGQCSYRRPLSQTLAADGCDVAFVGPRSVPNGDPPSCRATNTRHAGFPGWKAEQFIDASDLTSTYMSQYEPDYVLLHIGSNDINRGDSVSNAVADIDEIITRTFIGRPSAKVMLANVIPWDQRGGGNPNVDELARTTELSAALEVLAADRKARGEAVFLVDVATGFDSDAMTFDGIHPNAIGEQFMASRFLASLKSAGACGAPPSPLPSLTLADNTWAQISLPADPGSESTVADIFDELPMSKFNNSWAIFGTDLSNADEFAYERLALNSRMRVGQAYWVIQRSGRPVSIRMPSTSKPVPTDAGIGCAPGKTCFPKRLRSNSSKLLWNFIGFPFSKTESVANLRVATTGGNCARGCTLNESRNANVTGRVMFHADPSTATGYREIKAGGVINPWEGMWIPVLPEADGLVSRVLFAR